MTSPPAEVQQIANPSRASKMGAWLVGMGALHFAAPKPFDSIVPAELPGDARFYTYASGVGEIVTGGLLLVPRTRKLGALAAVALFLAVFPANVNIAAVLSLAGIGFDRTQLKVVADPALRFNTHFIRMKGRTGTIDLRFESVPSPDNPKTALLACYSALAAFRQFNSPIRYGT